MQTYTLIMELAGKHVIKEPMAGPIPRKDEELIVTVPEDGSTRDAIVTVERVTYRPRDGAVFVRALERWSARDARPRLITYLTGESEAGK